MAYGYDKPQSTGCGIGTLSDVSYTSPEEVLKGQFGSRQVYVGSTKYDQVWCFGAQYKWIHVYFSDYDHKSGVSSGEKLALYIEKHKLGTITRSPAIPNPAHPERPVGKGDVTAFIWTLDNPDGVTVWATKMGFIGNPVTKAVNIITRKLGG